MISLFLWWHFKRSEDTLLYCDAIAGPSCQHFGNAVNITNKTYISKYCQVKCSILSFYCTILFTGCSAKKTLKSLLHRERLRITQETLQMSLFASVLKFSKENCFTLPCYCTVLCAGRSTKEGLNHLLHKEFLRKNQETL